MLQPLKWDELAEGQNQNVELRTRPARLTSLAAVANRGSRRVDPGTQSRLGDDAPAPYGRNKVILADHALAVADQVFQQIKDLRLVRNQACSATQFAPVCVQGIFLE